MGKVIRIKQCFTKVAKPAETSKTCMTRRGTPRKSLRIIKSQIPSWHAHI